jgi:hypothetical protein
MSINLFFLLVVDKGSGLPYVKSRSPIPSDNHGRLVISKTPNAINPLVWGHSVSINSTTPSPSSYRHELMYLQESHESISLAATPRY